MLVNSELSRDLNHSKEKNYSRCLYSSLTVQLPFFGVEKVLEDFSKKYFADGTTINGTKELTIDHWFGQKQSPDQLPSPIPLSWGNAEYVSLSTSAD